ncbi:MAG TPA: hypothetical protein VNS58_28515 [Puia sp.]|nr:hypothetical protein [Puia sp.]
MTSEQFKIFWESAYPETIPIFHYLKHDYPDRWFRIHSLPGSKRYVETQDEWNILLDRQNTIISDLLGEELNVIMVTGDSKQEGLIELHPISAVDSIKSFSFKELDPFDLYDLNPGFYEKGQIYTPIFTEQAWNTDKFKQILKDIAEEQLEAFFISIDNNCIFAPYDGGMDIILKDTLIRNQYKTKYSSWLSPREDGL